MISCCSELLPRDTQGIRQRSGRRDPGLCDEATIGGLMLSLWRMHAKRSYRLRIRIMCTSYGVGCYQRGMGAFIFLNSGSMIARRRYRSVI